MGEAPGEIECTAFDTTATNERNALFTPPCECPRCTPPVPQRTEDGGPTTIWLRQRPGPPVRHDVIDLELGEGAKSQLG